MPRKKAEDNGEGLTLDAEQRKGLVEKMQALAFADPTAEQIVDKLARHLKLTEVSSHIAKLRAYAKRKQNATEAE